MKEFKSNYVMDLEIYKEFANGFISTSMRAICCRLIIIIYVITCFLLNQQDIAMMFISIYLLIILINKLTGRNLIQYKRSLSINNGKPVSTEVLIDETGIQGINIDKNNKTYYNFNQILSVTETKNLIILKMKYNLGIIINKNNLEGGSKEALINFIFDKCQNIKKKKVVQSKYGEIFLKLYILMLIVLFVIAVII